MQRGGTASGTEPTVGRVLARREFLRLSGVGLAGMALLGTASPALGETATAAPKLGISPSNSPSRNRKNLVKALTNSARSVVFPPGDYRIDNSGSYIVIRNFSGKLSMESGARFVFTDSTKRGLMFEKGSGARFYGLKSAFKVSPSQRVSSQICILFTESADTLVQNIDIQGSAGAGLLFGRCIRPTVDGAVIKNTMGDGLHFANCQDARAENVTTENTGDDGLAFLNYASSGDNTGGIATNITVKRSKARGIAVVGQRNVRIEGFRIEDTDGNGLYCAREVNYNTRKPSNVQFDDGIVRNAGRPDGPGGTNYGICFHHVGAGIVFENIKVISPAARGVSGHAISRNAKLSNVEVRGAAESGFHLTSGAYSLDTLVTKNSGKTGFYIADNRLVSYKKLRSVNSSRKDSLGRAFTFARNKRVEGDRLTVIDNKRRATGYKVNTTGEQSGRLGTIYDGVVRAKVQMYNASRLSYKGPVQL